MNAQTEKACLPKNKQNKPAHNQGKFSNKNEISTLVLSIN